MRTSNVQSDWDQNRLCIAYFGFKYVASWEMTNQVHYITKEGSVDGGSNAVFMGALTFCQQWNSGQASFTINTSGSTGIPKPITISRTQMEASASMTASALGLSAGDHALVCLNTDYIAGKMMLVRGMVNQLNLFITEPSSNPLQHIPDNLSIDFMAVVPLQLESIIDTGHAGIDKLNQMKAVIVGGAPVSPALAEKIKQLSCPVYATYGMTETVSHIALKRMNGDDASDHFQVLDGVTITQDERGCLTINSILTNHETIVTNDVVNILAKNRFEWLGRADNVINSGGVKIHPEQLEHKVKEILTEQGIDCNFIIAGIAHEALGENIILILETQELGTHVLNSLKSTLKKSLPRYHVPKGIYYLGQFDYTETGKVKRNETVNQVL